MCHTRLAAGCLSGPGTWIVVVMFVGTARSWAPRTTFPSQALPGCFASASGILPFHGAVAVVDAVGGDEAAVAPAVVAVVVAATVADKTHSWAAPVMVVVVVLLLVLAVEQRGYSIDFRREYQACESAAMRSHNRSCCRIKCAVGLNIMGRTRPGDQEGDGYCERACASCCSRKLLESRGKLALENSSSVHMKLKRVSQQQFRGPQEGVYEM